MKKIKLKHYIDKPELLEDIDGSQVERIEFIECATCHRYRIKFSCGGRGYCTGSGKMWGEQIIRLRE